MTEEARQQWKAPIEWFITNVKCCYNCNHWCETLCAADKAYAKRFRDNFCKHKDLLSAFDYYCEDYCGNAIENNLIITLTKEECETLLAEEKKIEK